MYPLGYLHITPVTIEFPPFNTAAHINIMLCSTDNSRISCRERRTLHFEGDPDNVHRGGGLLSASPVCPAQRALAYSLNGVQLEVLKVEHQLDLAVGAGSQGPNQQVLVVQDGGTVARPPHPQAARALRPLLRPPLLLSARSATRLCTDSSAAHTLCLLCVARSPQPPSVTWSKGKNAEHSREPGS